MADEHGDIASASDELLVEALKAGENEAFTELMRRYKSRVFGTVYHYLGDADEAADAAQDTFVSIYRNISAFSGRSRLATWIYRIAANAAINALRQRGRTLEATAISLDERNDDDDRAAIEPAAKVLHNPRAQLQRKELNEVLRQKLEQLPEAYRLTFILREMREMSYEDIAEITDVPIGTVRSRLFQARRRLRELLRPYLQAEPHRPAAV